jgi:phage terminase large subunit GpA-like protein
MNAWEEGFLKGLKPQEPLTVDEWADKYRVLSSRGSSEPGRFRSARTPYLIEPMRELSTESLTQRVILMFASQLGKTESMNNWTGYCIDFAPGALLLVQPTLQMAARLSKQRLEPMLQETPCLADKIPPARSRDSGNSQFAKTFPGGVLILTGANSAASLKSMPARYIGLDEIDSYPGDLDGEGEPCALAEKRASTYTRRKILLTSTPTIKEASRIEDEYEASDQRKYFVPCPICNFYQVLLFDQLRYDSKKLEKVEYECISCKERFDETAKTTMLRKGEWRATKPENAGKTAGFWLNGLNSPLGWFSWHEMADEFLKAKNDPSLLRAFTNTRLCQTFSYEYQAKLNAEALMETREDYLPGTIPEPVVCLCLGVDVQGGLGSASQRLEVSCWGFAPDPSGLAEQMYLIDHNVIAGDPNQSEVWRALDVLLNADYEHPSGAKLKISACAVDSGGLATQSVYDYCMRRKGKGVIAIKGSSRSGGPIIGKGSRVDINYSGKIRKKSGIVYLLNTEDIKDRIFSKIKGEGKIHFHAETTEEYFKELTGEYRTQKTNSKGYPVSTYEKKPNQAVEKLDCCVYAYSAYSLLLKATIKGKFFETYSKKLLNSLNSSSKNTLKLKNTMPKQSYVNQW